MSNKNADMIEKAALTIIALTKERDGLREELSAVKEAADRAEALENVRPFVPDGTDPDEYLTSFLDNGGTIEGIKEARRLFPDVDEGFSVAEDKGTKTDDSMAEVNDIVFGEL